MAATFILRFTGEGPAPEEDIERIRALAGARIVEVAGRMLLVEAPADAIERLVGSLDGWVMSAERGVRRPDPRRRPGRPPDE